MRVARHRRRTSPWLPAGLAAVLLLSLVQLVPAPASAAPQPPSGCTLVPVLRDFTVNQGVGSTASPAASYSPLTRGKETLVRLYLSKPACATERTQTMSLTGASLTMSIAGSASKVYPTLNPVSTSSSAPMVLYTSAPAPDASSDPKFVIPGADLVSSDAANRFTPTFTATLKYLRAGSTAEQTVTVSSVAGGPLITTTVEQKTKALRVLVVPMGTPLTSTDSSVLQAGLNSLSQKLPVPKAGGQLTGPLTATSNVGGIRYAVNAGVAPVTLQSSTGKYCGNLSNFSDISARLAQYRNDWNTANSTTGDADTNPTADVVLGVVSGAGSLGSESGCAEGMASTNTPVAWVRLVPGGTSPSTAGNLMAMEVAHTFNASGSWGDPASPTHSANTQADAGTNRAYNITSRSFLSDDRSTMKAQSTGWNQDTTVFEQRDFNFLMCRLGGRPNTDCTTTGTVGTINGVASGPAFVLAGTTDNTPLGTHIVESYAHPETPLSPDAPDSPYRVEFLRPAGGPLTKRVPVEFRASEHEEPAGSADHQAPEGLITLTVPFDQSSNDFRFFYDPPGDAPEVLLFSSRRNGKPVLRDLSVAGGGSGGGDFVNYTDDPGNDLSPAVSPDGAWVAWTARPDGGALLVAPASDSTLGETYFHNAEDGDPIDPTWSPDARSIAFATTGGSIYTVPVVFGEQLDFGSPQEVYRNSDLPAASPSFSPDGSRITFDTNGNIWTIGADGSGLTSLTTFSEESALYASDPSWSQTEGDGRIVFSVLSRDEVQPSGLYTIDPDRASEPVPLTEDFGEDPSWGTDGLIAYVADGRIQTVSAQPTSEPAPEPSDGPIFFETGPSFAATDEEQPAIDGQRGDSPSYVRRGVSAFVSDLVADGGTCDFEFCSQSDVFLERSGPPSVTAVGGVDGGDTDEASLNRLRLTLYYQCLGVPERSVLALALPPTSVQPANDGSGTALFTQTFDASQLCGGSGDGEVTGVLSDFFTSAAFPQDPDFDPLVQSQPVAPGPQGPVPSIVYPAEGATFLSWESVALQGEGLDAARQQLPDDALTWTAAGRPASGSTVDLAALPVGSHVVTLTATDPATGLSEQASRTIHVLADGDRDGLSDAVENDTPCFADDAAADGTSIDADSDGDGIPDGQDPAPCQAAVALTPTAIFDPETLYVPSKGASVTMYVKQDRGVPDLAGVVAGSVRLTSITGVLRSGERRTVSVVGKPFAQSKEWSVSGVAGRDQLGTAKFDRQKLNAFIADTFRLNQQLTLTLAGYSSLPSFTFTGSGTTLAKKG